MSKDILHGVLVGVNVLVILAFIAALGRLNYLIDEHERRISILQTDAYGMRQLITDIINQPKEESKIVYMCFGDDGAPVECKQGSNE